MQYFEFQASKYIFEVSNPLLTKILLVIRGRGTCQNHFEGVQQAMSFKCLNLLDYGRLFNHKTMFVYLKKSILFDIWKKTRAIRGSMKKSPVICMFFHVFGTTKRLRSRQCYVASCRSSLYIYFLVWLSWLK